MNGLYLSAVGLEFEFRALNFDSVSKTFKFAYMVLSVTYLLPTAFL